MTEYFWSQFLDRFIDTITVLLILVYAVFWVLVKGDDDK